MNRLQRIGLGAALVGMLLASPMPVAVGVEFTVENSTDSVRTDVVGVSLPVACGLLKGELPQSVRMNDRDYAVWGRRHGGCLPSRISLIPANS
jgi:hypothetical protein